MHILTHVSNSFKKDVTIYNVQSALIKINTNFSLNDLNFSLSPEVYNKIKQKLEH